MVPLEAGARDVCGPAATSVCASLVITIAIPIIIVVLVLAITATVTGIPAAGSAQLVLSVVVFIIVIVVAVIVFMMAIVAIIAVVSIAGSSVAAFVRNPCMCLHPPPLRRGRCRCIAADTRLREPTGASTDRIRRGGLRRASPAACVLLRSARGTTGAS